MSDTYHTGNNAEIEVFENEGILRKIYSSSSFVANDRKGVINKILETAKL